MVFGVLWRIDCSFLLVQNSHEPKSVFSAEGTMKEEATMRIALFHDNLAQMGGAERVTEVLHRTLPGADLYSTLTVPRRLSSYLQGAGVRTTWMQFLPMKGKFFRHYFPLYPLAVETVDLSSYDLVVTSCFGFAKGVRRHRTATHICYCHTPMRWICRYEDYFAQEKLGFLKRVFLQIAFEPLRNWERRAAHRPDFYIANSRVVAKRLMDSFGVPSEVISPPIETSRFVISNTIEDYFLVLSRLVPYKRLDLAVRAATELSVPLKVIGSDLTWSGSGQWLAQPWNFWGGSLMRL